MTTGTTAIAQAEQFSIRHAAMEPRRDDGDDSRESRPYPNPPLTPQWSPVVTTGTTLQPQPDERRRPGAAMEPRRDDGDDVGGPDTCPTITSDAAMEPRRDDGDEVARA
mgnify:CR=1 FL=1